MDTREGLPTGLMDQADPSEKMAAVDKAMRLYFQSKDWVQARAKEFPGLERARHNMPSPGVSPDRDR